MDPAPRPERTHPTPSGVVPLRQRNTLLAKTILAVAASTVGVLLALALPLGTIWRDSFDQLEQREIRLHVQRTRNALADALDSIQVVARDYAAWDETFNFLQDGNSAYLAANFIDATFDQNHLNVALFLGLDGTVRYQHGRDFAGKADAAVPPWFLTLPADHPIRHLRDKSVTGIAHTHNGLYLVAASQVLKSGDVGATNGTLVFGRKLDELELARLTRTLRLDLQLLAPTGTAADLQPDRIEVIDDRHISGIAVLQDMTGAPVGRLRVTTERAIAALARQDSLELLAVLVLSGVLFAVVMVVVLQKVVLRRLEGLVAELGQVRTYRDPSLRVTVRGNDEVAEVCHQINSMLATLQTSQAELSAETQRSGELLRNILPDAIAERLKRDGGTIADSYDEVSVLFADIVGFTEMASRLSPEMVVNHLSALFSAFDMLAEHHGVEKIKTIGDAYMVVAGLPNWRDDHARALCDMALAMQDAVADFNVLHGTELAIRVGIHTGPVVAGVIGVKKFNYDIWGDTVNIASRMESAGAAGRVHISDTTRKHLGDNYAMEPRGAIPIKGKGDMQTWFLARTLS